MKTIYLDYNATTPVAPEVVKEMLPFLTGYYGNPSSNHVMGKKAKAAVNKARKQVAFSLGCSPEEIVFTSGGSEANNHAIKGVAFANKYQGNHIITSQIEHPSVLNTCCYLESQGFEVTYLPVDKYGMVNSEEIEKNVLPSTILISIMHANNEMGTIQPISEIGEIARRKGVYFHTDAAQTVGKISTLVEDLKVDLLTMAGQKFYAPKGVGALYIRNGTFIEPFIHGAGHEGNRRAGTENVAGIVGLGKACELAANSLTQKTDSLIELRDMFFGLLQEQVGGVNLNGHPYKRLPNTLNVSFEGVNATKLLDKLPDLCVSTGSACHQGLQTMSPVLMAMGINSDRGHGAVRFTLGQSTTWKELHEAVYLLKKEVSIMRNF